jgi:hypothetical protein
MRGASHVEAPYAVSSIVGDSTHLPLHEPPAAGPSGRFEEKDGGVYVQVESIGLSRAVPAIIGWLVNPLLRSIPRGTLFEPARRYTCRPVAYRHVSNILHQRPKLWKMRGNRRRSNMS